VGIDSHVREILLFYPVKHKFCKITATEVPNCHHEIKLTPCLRSGSFVELELLGLFFQLFLAKKLIWNFKNQLVAQFFLIKLCLLPCFYYTGN
jgi:hypothetical protein